MKNNTHFTAQKSLALQHCHQFISSRIARIQLQIAETVAALSSETKSSAGDKHETGRAMVQLEREKLGSQLAEAEKMLQVLRNVPTATMLKTVGLGTLVITANASYFIAISAGEVLLDDKAIYCISAGTPIAKLLWGKMAGDTFSFQNKEIEIIQVV